MNKWTYLARTIADIGDLFSPLEEAIRHRFLPTLTGLSAFSDAERDLMALPVHLGGLGITNPTNPDSPPAQYFSESQVSSPDPAAVTHLPK